MPRKPSEIDVIDGVIFQSFETPEGMQGCFQYTGPSLPVVVRRTSRERKPKFSVKDRILNQRKKSSATISEANHVVEQCDTVALTEPLTEPLLVTTDSPSHKAVTTKKRAKCRRCCKCVMGNVGELQNKAKPGELGFDRVDNIEPVVSDRKDPVSSGHLSFCMPRNVNTPDTSQQLGTNLLDFNDIPANSGQCNAFDIQYCYKHSSLTMLTEQRKKKRRKRKQSKMFLGVKFGSLSRRVKGKTKKKTTSKPQCTVTHLAENEEDVQDVNQQIDWMTPPDSQNGDPSHFKRTGITDVSRELVFKPKETPSNFLPNSLNAGTTPCGASPRKHKKNKIKRPRHAKSVAHTNSVGELDDVTDTTKPVTDDLLLDSQTGQWRLVEKRKRWRPVFQNCLSFADPTCSVLLPPETMTLPSRETQQRAMSSGCDAIPSSVLDQGSPVQKKSTSRKRKIVHSAFKEKDTKSFSSELKKMLTENKTCPRSMSLGSDHDEQPLFYETNTKMLKAHGRSKKKKVPTATLR